MPAIVGPLQIYNVGSGIVHFGDTAVISPKQVQKHLPAPVLFPLPHLSLQTTRSVQTIRLTAVLSTSHLQEIIRKAERAGKFSAASLLSKWKDKFFIGCCTL